MVNVIWFGSIVVCISCAVFATLIQKSAQRYLELTQGRGTPSERARVRTYLFNGIRRFHASRFFHLLGMSMHISLLLYCVGLILFVFSVDERLVPFSIFYIACSIGLYTAVTVLPFFSLDCPYVTPFTAPSWHLYHLVLLGIFWTIRFITHLPHVLLTLGPQTSQPVSWSHRWRITLNEQVDKHRKRLSDGLQRSIELHAMDATAPERNPTYFVDNYSEKEVHDFTAWVPEFFGTYAQSGAEGTILMSDQAPTKTIFGLRLRHLLKIYIQGSSALSEEQRRSRLQVCLECLWCWARACRQNAASLPSYFPLPNLDMIRRLQAEQDPTAAIIARCLSALVAEKLAADVTSHHSSDVRDHRDDTKLEALSAILGRTRTELEAFLSQPGAIGLANIVSLTSSVLKILFTEEVPSAEVLVIFRTTVDILLAEDSMTSLGADLPPNLVSSLRKTYSNSQQPPAPESLKRQLGPILEKLDA